MTRLDFRYRARIAVAEGPPAPSITIPIFGEPVHFYELCDLGGGSVGVYFGLRDALDCAPIRVAREDGPDPEAVDPRALGPVARSRLVPAALGIRGQAVHDPDPGRHLRPIRRADARALIRAERGSGIAPEPRELRPLSGSVRVASPPPPTLIIGDAGRPRRRIGWAGRSRGLGRCVRTRRSTSGHRRAARAVTGPVRASGAARAA